MKNFCSETAKTAKTLLNPLINLGLRFSQIWHHTQMMCPIALYHHAKAYKLLMTTFQEMSKNPNFDTYSPLQFFFQNAQLHAKFQRQLMSCLWDILRLTHTNWDGGMDGPQGWLLSPGSKNNFHHLSSHNYAIFHIFGWKF